MILNNEEMIEQQWKVQYGQTQKILSRKIVIYRYKKIATNSMIADTLYFRANMDIGKLYDIPQIIGKTLTWLTGIKLFVRLLGAFSIDEEICVTRIGDWYEDICNFGVRTKSELTTKIIDEYCLTHPEEWEIVYYHE
jgi:hypothetical protein